MTFQLSDVDRYSHAHAGAVARSLTNAVTANLRYRHAVRSNDHILAAAIEHVAAVHHWTLEETPMPTPNDSVTAAIAAAEHNENIRTGTVELTPAEIVAHALGKEN